MTTTDAVLFDFGGVFTDSPFAAVADAAARLEIPVGELTDLMFGPYHDDTDHPWHQLERGEITLADASARIVAGAEAAGRGPLDPVTILVEASASGFGLREFMLDLVRDCRDSGRRTGIITNNVVEFSDAWRSLLPVDELFDDVVDSSAVGCRKPSREIFALACERLGVRPDRTLFIDDHEGNVEGARRAGMVALCCGYTRESTEAADRRVR